MELEVVYNYENTNTLVGTEENITELSNYNYKTSNYTAESIVPNEIGCYIIKVKYGEVENFEFAHVSSMSQKMCYHGPPKPPCVLTPVTPTLMEVTPDRDMDNLVHGYIVDVYLDGYCEDVSGYVTTTDEAGNSWTSEQFGTQPAYPMVI